MRKVLFIDRDGTLIKEPETDFQVDSLEKLEFMPGVFRALYSISTLLDYELAIVTNQDGLGTESFPEETFRPAQNKMLKAFENEGILFDEIFIDSTLPADNAITRKPGTGMLKKYFEGDYNLAESFVIGDRITDVQLAKNLGAKAIVLANGNIEKEINNAGLSNSCSLIAHNWESIFAYLRAGSRTATIKRITKETQIKIDLDLDGTGISEIQTGLGFFDHMLEQISKHANVNLSIQVSGDLEVDEHHTIEDTALALGEAIKKALGNKKGLERYGFALPMDESMAQVLIDFGGRPWLVWDAGFTREKIGDMPTEMFMHFFKSFSDAAACNLNIKAEGQNEHHKIEGIFKAFARAIKMAKQRNVFEYQLPSTKGIL
ncbi:MAG: bifunctional histidinol-phosphatase/imidazoleglycerol-phosphate dehydratase HisB [Bacteroidales bacterium]|nr:bifunctional histidinol-phosphatase/imidazoleglycerol-phosphate dehydratase HisB [Bacteroidales bacterium]MBN2821011.1 bifunctional histidinol-phosphatase/imidazoleglycerol-phosphate dehydratase HisB [Bacteroidales bacterium]